MKKTIAILLLLLLLAGCQKVNTDAAPAPTPAPTAEPEPAPTEEPPAEAAPAQYAFTFSAKTLEGQKVTQEFFGQYDLTMVNVWASWCGPCKSELPELAELYGKLPENVGFLSITV
ncbi:MAG: TlpA family protein disulfide reductase, partial [Clostridia bacterium]|nr:TlpA family protein disulfide reductase [Clostridia bacterium]